LADRAEDSHFKHFASSSGWASSRGILLLKHFPRERFVGHRFLCDDLAQ
jgi:hypothetical protein